MKNVLVQLSNVIYTAKLQSLVIWDSVTDIATQSNTPHSRSNLMVFFRGLQRVSKERGAYLLPAAHPEYPEFISGKRSLIYFRRSCAFHVGGRVPVPAGSG
ncbi:MAG: hypothetical protein WCF90_04870 [Methanomicrobiales archaeon]